MNLVCTPTPTASGVSSIAVRGCSPSSRRLMSRRGLSHWAISCCTVLRSRRPRPSGVIDPNAPSTTSTSTVRWSSTMWAAMVTGKCDKLSSEAGRNVAPLAVNSPPLPVHRAGSSRRPAGCRTFRQLRPTSEVRSATGSCGHAAWPLHLAAQDIARRHRLRVQAHTKRHGVDEQSDHRLDACEFSWAGRTP